MYDSLFDNIPKPVLSRMHYLEQVDARDRTDGTERMERLRQIQPDTGRFLAILAASTPKGRIIEIGTSAGYSALWLILACRATGKKLTTFEVLPEKLKLARETFETAGVTDHVELIAGDARDHLPHINDIGFCFLDAEKEIYRDCYDIVIPRLVPGGTLVADNVISHAEQLGPLVDLARTDDRVDAVVIPIDKGELLCRRR